MKVNSINPLMNARVQAKGAVKKTGNPQQPAEGISVISFRGGNKEQAILYVAETKPYFQEGGVATVMQDLRALRVSDKDPIVTDEFKNTHGFYAPKNKAVVDPFYNGSLIYSTDGVLQRAEVPRIPEGLPENSPFKKYTGKYFMTKNQNFSKYLNPKEFFEKENKLKLNGDVWILEDVTGGKKTMDFGGGGETEIKLFRVFREDAGQLKPTSDFKIFTDVHATWPKPYSEGGYSSTVGALAQSWKGDGDARGAKAFIELMPRIGEVMSEGGQKFDPATVMLNDSQAAYATEYMAQKAATGDEYWKGKKPTMVGHNLGDGYIQKRSYMNMFMDIADAELRNAVDKDPKFNEALRKGSDAVNAYFGELLPDVMKDAQGGVSPFMNTLYYAQKGYVPMISTVSEGYWEKLVSDPEFAPGTYQYLKELSDKGQFRGILNAFENIGMSPYSGGVGGYYKEYVFPEDVTVAGQKGVKIQPYKVYDKALVNENSVDINHVRDIKRQNKISLFERLDKDVLEALEKLKKVKGHETDYSTVIAGLHDKKVKAYGHIDKKYLDIVKQPNGDVKLLTAWGRGDTQKALDSVLEAFEKYVLGPGKNEKNSVLVMGGALKQGDADSEKILKIINRMNDNPELRGRFVYLDGFAPNKPLASAADFSVFPSRFAPCELTDLESMKVFCSPIVTDCQGLAQKNFDASILGEADKVTGYKTKHDYNISLKQLKELLPESDKAKLEEDVKKFRDTIKRDYQLKHAGQEMTDEVLDALILKDGGLHYEYNFKVLRPYRDKIVSDELATCFERALIIDRNAEVQTKMVQNHLKQYTDWERNGRLSRTGKSSAQLYREYHFQKDGAAIAESDTLLSKIKAHCKELGLFDRSKQPLEGGKVAETQSWLSKHKKLAWAGGAVALAGLGYAFARNYRAKNNEDKNADEKRLSCVG